MSGIAGFYSERKNISLEELHAMCDSLQHRGPDNEGFFYSETVGMVHRRLKIIDLSDDANQPMTCPCNKFRIVSDGEIYNFDELRREQGWKTHTNSDTEILLWSFREWGTDMFQWLNGMFAFVIQDIEKDELYLVRDRIGSKPLYYYWDGEDFAFASEIKALQQISKIKKNLTINNNVLSTYLHLGLIPEPATIYKNIFTLPAGSWLKFSHGTIQTSTYWDVKDCYTNNIISDEIQAKEILRDLINDSVRYSMITDTSFGILLNGDVDSSLIAAVAQRNSREKIKTFSVMFEGHDSSGNNVARKVADYLKTEHEELFVTEKHVLELIKKTSETFNEPLTDINALSKMVIAEAIQKKVSMVLSGGGGNHLFCGNDTTFWAEQLQKKIVVQYKTPFVKGVSILGKKYKMISEMYTFSDKSHLPGHILSQDQKLFSELQISELLTHDYNNILELNYYPNLGDRKLEEIENQALFDFLYRVQQSMLPKVDEASMKFSLGIRFPLLDHNIIDFAVNVSKDLKIKGGMRRYLLKQVLFEYIPAEIFTSNNSAILEIPLHRWLKGELGYLIDQFLSKSVVEKHGIIHYKVIEVLLKRFYSGRSDYLCNRVWSLIVLHMFLEK